MGPTRNRAGESLGDINPSRLSTCIQDQIEPHWDRNAGLRYLRDHVPVSRMHLCVVLFACVCISGALSCKQCQENLVEDQVVQAAKAPKFKS